MSDFPDREQLLDEIGRCEEEIAMLKVEIEELKRDIEELRKERSEFASMGGRAAASSLSDQERSDRARKAANARWHGKVP